MKLPVKPVILILVFLGLGAAVVLILRPKRGREGVAPAGVTATANLPGGEELTLEIFSPEGRRLWRLRLEEASFSAGDTFTASAIEADYYATEPATAITAQGLVYEPRPNRLLLRKVFLTGPALTLRGEELHWDGEADSFAVEGGYSLAKDGVTLEGEGLVADGDFGAIRTRGAARLKAPLEGSGAK